MDSNNAILNFFIQNATIENVIKFLLVYFFIVWIAVIVWVIRDITNRSESIFIQLLSIFSVLILTPLGIFIYLIIRPAKTLFERYYEEVESNLDSLSQEIQSKIGEENLNTVICINCNHEVERDFKYCTECGFKLKKKCKGCARELEIDWKNCPYCGDKNNKKKKDD